MARTRLVGALLALVLVVAGCAERGGRVESSSPATEPVVASERAEPRVAAEEPTAAPVPPQRLTAPSRWAPFASVQGVVLVHPAEIIERVGFHQSNHEGARELTVAPTAVHAVTLESRERLSSAHSAADVVVDPGGIIRAPVTGRVLRAGSYVLYCRHTDDYVVIEPDARPGWEVKVLHVQGERVDVGQRVEAGVTEIAAGPTQLPFTSQVDKLRTVDPAWPHVHIEVVDPSIPNVPSPGGGSGC